MSLTKNNNDFELFFSGNIGVPNVLIFTEHVNATYYISFDIPLKVLHKNGEVNFAVVSQNYMSEKGLDSLTRWNDSYSPDIVIMTRYALPFGNEILNFFKSRNIKVIYHIDDDLLHLPDSLGEEIQKRQGAIEVIESRTYLLNNCDLIYASTEYLAKLLQSRFPEQSVYFGIYASFIEGIEPTRLKQSNTLTIGYMGSKGHQNDLALVEDCLVNLMQEFPNLRFEVFGTIKMPEKLEQFGARVKSHRVNKNYFEFIEYLASLNWDVGLAPLEDLSFNHCKAPTKYIEYSAAGIPVVATDIPVYRNASVQEGIVLVDSDGWYSGLKKLLEDKVKRLPLVANARAHCSDKFSVKKLQGQLKEVIYLSSGKFK